MAERPGRAGKAGGSIPPLPSQRLLQTGFAEAHARQSSGGCLSHMGSLGCIWVRTERSRRDMPGSAWQ